MFSKHRTGAVSLALVLFQADAKARNVDLEAKREDDLKYVCV
jgi:hypothetical protein